jgi:hypothetical protein
VAYDAATGNVIMFGGISPGGTPGVPDRGAWTWG